MSKKFLTAFFVFFFALLPTSVYAWGPLTHVYLGTEVFFLGTLLPAGLYSVIRRFRQDFIYGNLMADFVIGKKYLPLERSPHSWDVALRLMGASNTDSEKAFSLGYLSHLAADTVAHDIYTKGVKDIEHTFLELRADSVIDKRYWLQAMSIERKVQRRNDRFLEMSSPRRAFFSFNTNKRLFKGMVILSGLNKERFGDFIDRNIIISGASNRENIKRLHEESLDRMVDVLKNGRNSVVLKGNPMSRTKTSRLAGLFVA